ncbi:MAG: hypothetical protein Q8O13_02765 [Candidatus Omnitrophota bacterium]|nr:hypothetical protein [Candidatus Omnitrophota bacterium]
MRYILITIISLLLLAGNTVSSFAGGLTNIEKGILKLEHIGMQINAVENDLRFYYMVNEKDRPAVAPKEEIRNLKKIDAELSNLKLPQELDGLRLDFKKVVDKFLDNCKDIVTKNTETMDREFEELWQMISAYNEKLKSTGKKYIEFPDLPKDFDLVDAEAGLFPDKTDQEQFKKADSLMEKKQYAEAENLLSLLLKKYKNEPTEGSIMYRIVNCYQMKDSSLRDKSGGEEYELNILSDYVGRKLYSSRIVPLYRQWRVLEQQMNSGVSNWSDIPNAKYVQVLWDLAMATQNYIERHPDDYLAKINLLMLMDTPIIQRFSDRYAYGNTITIDYANLFGLLEDKK